tara:strand:- start:387 stop:1151 length:765 start_codon:yes stop_codon:yes gene_type:complete
MISKKDFKLIYHEWNNLNDDQKINLLMNLKKNNNTDVSNINQMVEKYSSNHILTIFKHVLVGGGRRKGKNARNPEKKQSPFKISQDPTKERSPSPSPGTEIKEITSAKEILSITDINKEVADDLFKKAKKKLQDIGKLIEKLDDRNDKADAKKDKLNEEISKLKIKFKELETKKKSLDEKIKEKLETNKKLEEEVTSALKTINKEFVASVNELTNIVKTRNAFEKVMEDFNKEADKIVNEKIVNQGNDKKSKKK